MKLLIAQSDIDSENTLNEIFLPRQFEIINIMNPEQVIDIYKKESPDVCLIDWDLKKPSGLDICKQIKEFNDEAGKITYLIITSKQSIKRDMFKALDAGVEDFILKPYSKEVVFSRIDVAVRILNAKYRKHRAEMERGPDPLAILRAEHDLLRRMSGILEFYMNMLDNNKTEFPNRLIKWMGSTVFYMNWEWHEVKEYNYIAVFMERAKMVHGETTKLFAWSSMTQIMREHEIIKKLIFNVYSAAMKYDVENINSGKVLTNEIRRLLPLIRMHYAREDDIFFPFTEKYLNSEDKKKLVKNFRLKERDEKLKIAERLKMIERLEEIANLNGTN